MNSLRALGFFMEYCNHNMDRDPNVTQERFQAGNMLILDPETSALLGAETERM